MHPAPSIILFTTLSGLGFGLLFWLGIGALVPTGAMAFVWFTIAYALAVGGLVSSLFHLGRPERAWKSFSQWRSSWLSREGVAAVATLLVMALYGAGLVFFRDAWAPLGWLGALGAVTTVFTTSMIYTQMKTVPRWRHWSTPAIFLGLSLGGGGLLAAQLWPAVVLLLLTGAIQLYAWVRGDGALAASGTDLASATGLGDRGAIRAFEPPHTGSNYLLREFVFVVGRRHSTVLRVLALGFGVVIPAALLALAFGHVVGLVAVASHLAGVLALRWLFFAEAEHVVGLYYGKR